MTNVTRGLLRLWIVVSVMWAVGAGSVVWWEEIGARHLSELGTKQCDPPDWVFNSRTQECLPEWALQMKEPSDPDAYLRVQRNVLGYAALAALLPPIAVLIIGASLVWVVRGFRSHPPSAL
jgi:hypothetical protein